MPWWLWTHQLWLAFCPAHAPSSSCLGNFCMSCSFCSVTLGVHCCLCALIILKNPGVTFLIQGLFSLVLKTRGPFVIQVSAQMCPLQKDLPAPPNLCYNLHSITMVGLLQTSHHSLKLSFFCKFDGSLQKLHEGKTLV